MRRSEDVEADLIRRGMSRVVDMTDNETSVEDATARILLLNGRKECEEDRLEVERLISRGLQSNNGLLSVRFFFRTFHKYKYLCVAVPNSIPILLQRLMYLHFEGHYRNR